MRSTDQIKAIGIEEFADGIDLRIWLDAEADNAHAYALKIFREIVGEPVEYLSIMP